MRSHEEHLGSIRAVVPKHPEAIRSSLRPKRDTVYERKSAKGLQKENTKKGPRTNGENISRF